MKIAKSIACVVILLLVGWGVWYVALRPAWLSQLSIPFTVHIERLSGDGTPIKAVRCSSFFTKERRAFYLERLQDVDRLVDGWNETADPFDGKPLEIRITGGSTESRLFITLSYHHEKYLLVVADLADGRRVATIADIPDARTTREMRVTLP